MSAESHNPEPNSDAIQPTERNPRKKNNRISERGKKEEKITGSENVERLKIKYNFWKWFLGTFLIGLFTAISTQIIKQHEFKLKTRTEESAYLQPLLKVYLDNIGTNKLNYDRCAEMAKFLSLTVADDDYKRSWDSLYRYCKAKAMKYISDSVKNQKSLDSLQKLNNWQTANILNLKANGEQQQAEQLQKAVNNLTQQIQQKRFSQEEISKKVDPPVYKPQPIQNSATGLQFLGTVQKAVSGVKGFDIESVVSASLAQQFMNDGYSFCIRYIPRTADQGLAPGNLTNGEAIDILNAGLALMAVQHVPPIGWAPTATMGTSYGNCAATYSSQVVGLPQGMNIWLDLEGVAPDTNADDVIAYCKAWFNEVQKQGYVPGIYVGYSCGLNGKQLSELPFQYFWRSFNGPDINKGYQMTQKLQLSAFGTQFDPNTTQTDRLGGSVLWVKK